MRYLLLAIAVIPLFPAMASAQSWQEWTRQNPTYPSLEPSPAPSVAPAPAPARTRPSAAPAPVPSALPPLPTNTRPGLTLRSPEFVNAFMQGCTQGPGHNQKPFCACVVRKIQNNYTIEQVAEIRNRFNSPAFRYEFAEKVVRPCAELVVR